MKKPKEFQFDFNESFPNLSNAPIVEAVIHWIAKPDKPLAKDVLRMELERRFPDYSEYKPLRRLEWSAEFSDETDSTKVQHGDGWHGFQLTSTDRLHVIQINRDGLVFSRLSPYDAWDQFSQEAMRIWGQFVELANPSEIQRLGVRFINRISPIDVSRIGKYLVEQPKTLKIIGLGVEGFLQQTVHSVPGYPFQVKVVQALQPAMIQQSGDSALIVDIDVGTIKPFQVDESLLQEYLAKMRWLKDKVFFGLISKSAISVFQRSIP